MKHVPREREHAKIIFDFIQQQKFESVTCAVTTLVGCQHKSRGELSQALMQVCLFHSPKPPFQQRMWASDFSDFLSITCWKLKVNTFQHFYNEKNENKHMPVTLQLYKAHKLSISQAHVMIAGGLALLFAKME